MRISTQQIYNSAVTQMQKGQTNLAQLQERIASGKELLRPSDDPIAAAQILKLEREVARTEKFEENIDVSERRLSLEEITLDQINTATDRLKELVIQGSNGTLTDADRSVIADEVKQLQGTILGLMNTQDAQGEYLFSGSQGHTQPFVRDPETQTFKYEGDDGQRFIQVGSNLQVASSDSGRSIFEVIKGDATVTVLGESTNRSNLATDITVTDSDDLVALTEKTGNLTVAVKVGYDPGPGTDPIYTYSLRDSSGAAVTGTVNGGSTEVVLDDRTFATSPADTLGIDGLELDINELYAIGGTPPLQDTQLSVGIYQGVAPDEENSTRVINPTMLSSGDQYAQFAAAEGDLTVNFFDDGLGNSDSLTYTVTSEAGNTIISSTVYVPGSTDTITIQDGSSNDLFRVKINGAQANGDEVTLRAQAEVELQTDQAHHSLLQTAEDLIVALESPITDQASRDQFEQDMAELNAELVAGQAGVLNVITQLGARQNSLETAREVNADFKLFTETALSQLEDLDYSKAISEFKLQELALQASQSTFAKVSNLTLFNFL